MTTATPPYSPRAANDAPAQLPRRRRGGDHTAPSATATTRPQPTRDQVGHPFKWYALLFALSCIGPLIDPGTRTQEDDTNNKEAPRTSAQPMAPTRPHNPFNEGDVPEHCAMIHGATQPPRATKTTSCDKATKRPAHSDADVAVQLYS